MAVLAAVAANVIVVGVIADARAATAVAAAWLLLFALVLIVLPRAAHAAFDDGRHAGAARRYRLLARVAIDPGRRAAAWVSVAGCHLAAGDHRRGIAVLDALDPAVMDPATRAAWLNNRAYAVVRSGADPAPALAWAEEATALRPDVPGLTHTLGCALLAAGRVDDAIRAFEAMWSSGDLPPRLEAERCLDLARAWERKGHHDYAADYRGRAARLCPDVVPAGGLPVPAVAELGGQDIGAQGDALLADRDLA